MKTFSNQVELTAFWEGFRGKAYKCPAGIWTLGYGTTRIQGDEPVVEGDTCTKKEALQDLTFHFNYLSGKMTKLIKNYVKLEISQMDAIEDYAYNAGENAFPALIKKLNMGDTEGASLEFLDGIYVAKKPLLGLLLRRISEYNTFINRWSYVAWEKGDPISQDLKNKLLTKNAKNQDAVNMINQLRVK